MHPTLMHGAVLAALALAGFSQPASPPVASKPAPYWNVDDARAGMKGYGCSVFKGSKIERFDVEVLGVLKNTSPARDLVLVRVAGCNLEKSGVIAGMSGSPVYIDGKLLGAVAYAWAFGKEPIAGVTPFCQMVDFVASAEQRDLAKRATPVQVRLPQPLQLGGEVSDLVNVSPEGLEPRPSANDGFWLVPLQTPLAAGGFTAHSLNLLRDRTRWAGLLPVQTGRAAGHLLEEEKDTALQPGSPLAVALVTGDFDLSGIGTVTHIEGDRVYGWGHPFMSLGRCELPLMSGFIHAIYPRQSVSFKMGSPIRPLGVIDADVSTCIAGRLGKQADMMPLVMTVGHSTGGLSRTFRCAVARQKNLMPQLIYTALTNSVDMEGDLPDELTAEMEARFEFENRPPLVIRDVYSGPSYAGGRAPASLFSQIASVAQILAGNPFERVRINSMECRTVLYPGRTSAEIEAAQLESETYAPGDTVRATAFLKPYKGHVQRVSLALALPPDLPEGSYSAVVCDDLANTRQELRDSPVLGNPTNLDQVFQALEMQTSAKRTNVVLRVPVSETGVAFDGQALPNLPGSMIEMLSNARKTGAQPLKTVLIARQPTEWVVSGSQTVKFIVVKNKRLLAPP